jgi:putative transposase
LRPDDGYRRMTQQLQAEGFRVNRKRIARLMHLHSLSKKPSRSEAVPDRFALQRPLAGLRDSARDATASQPRQPTGPYQMWVTDVSYAHISSCLVYAAAVIDAWSREVVGYAASLQITNRLARIALHSAVRAHRPAPGCAHHSTCGSQYFTLSFCELLRQYGLVPSSNDVAAAIGRSDARGTASHQIIEVEGYAGWKDVVDRPKEFVKALYTADRVWTILGRTATPDSGLTLAN